MHSPQIQPQRGALSGATSQRFNGVLQSSDGPIEVKDGVIDDEGEMFYVSDDGAIVTDSDHQIIAVVINGTVQELTPEIIQHLRGSGITS